MTKIIKGQKSIGMNRKHQEIPKPPVEGRVLLHSCCAPCSAALVERMLAEGLDVAIYYYNPNICPREEYEIRKSENKRFADSLGVEFFDDDWNHSDWLEMALPMANECERGKRCLQCFVFRLLKTAEYAQSNGFANFTTSLASSRWKSIEQIFEAGAIAQAKYPNTKFWARNWRKGGLSERRAELLRENGFYNQTYCGCEFSFRKDV